MTYICISKIDDFHAFKDKINVYVRGRQHVITKEGEDYWVTTIEGKKVKLKGYSIDPIIAILLTEEKLMYWDLCESLEDVNEMYNKVTQ